MSFEEATRTETERTERNWLPLAIAACVAVAILVAALVISHGVKKAAGVTTVTTAVGAPVDAYAQYLPISGIAMSESTNLAGGKVMYIDGHIANQGGRTVSGVTVQVLFRDYAHKVAQNETMPLTLIRMRDPYIDTELVSAAPLAPGAEQDFRLIFDSVSPDWAGETPELRLIRVDFK